ncbi:sugar ABC transporter ATP-binding protein [Amycolatopsis pigmentata]|uniref:Sugar ABC transporter ATP-binding protein n=1 Tax=Amycolatopsis pigmentata TaxID=450801 RepID=A0ABW5FM43_9PSEU
MNEGGAGLHLRRVSKTFPAQRALADVDLDLEPGRVHALLGQNGSGKSTLIKILAGYHTPDPGSAAWLNGEPLTLGSPSAAHRAGLRFIHQDLGLVPGLDVVDNLALGTRYGGRWWLRERPEAAAARALLSDFIDDVDVRRPVRDLSAAQQTIVAIARALRDRVADGGVLVLDEPTATLPEHEVDVLFETVRRVQRTGAAVLYVTHRLGEVFELADTVTVLRDGVKVRTTAVSATDHADLIAQIAGRPLEQLYPTPPEKREQVLLSARHLKGNTVREAGFDLHSGEILGVAGVDGSGRDELNSLLFGRYAADSGEVRVDGRVLAPAQPSSSIAAGLGYLPADRRNLAATPTMTVAENVTLPKIGKRPLGWLSRRSETRETLPWIRRLRVVPTDPQRPFSTLSGGNQQKALLARWLRCGSRVLLLDEPTQGVDIAGKRAIYDALGEAARDGAGVIVASSDADELAEICERVLVFRDGRLTTALEGPALTAGAIVTASLHEGKAS